MKKISVFLLFAICCLLFAFPVNALSPSATPAPTDKEPGGKSVINNLKERIASRVAQLKLVEKRGIIGIVSEVSDTQITISDLSSNTRFIDVDEITKFSSPSSKGSFGISDIPKNAKVGITGLYNKQSRRLLGRFVNVISIPKFIHGQVLSKDTEDYTFVIAGQKDEEYTIDIENITKTLSYTKENGLSKAGFSKIREGQRVIAVGFPDIKNGKKIIASRVLLFPEIGAKTITPSNKQSNPSDEITPSSGSGKKITPITK